MTRPCDDVRKKKMDSALPQWDSTRRSNLLGLNFRPTHFYASCCAWSEAKSGFGDLSQQPLDRLRKT